MEVIRVLIILYFTLSCSGIYDIAGFKFTPTKVFFEASSLLTLFGDDLNTINYSHNINVTVCKQLCHNVTNNMGNITCFVEERPFKGTYKESCNVTVSFINITEVTGEDKLTFVWPQFLNFTPTHGPVFGGTTVTFQGRNLNINKTILITVANVKCNIDETQNRGNGSVHLCNTSKSFNETPHCGNVETAIGDFTHTFLNDYFCYHGNPIITDVSPNMTLQRGGIILTALGENLEHGRNFDWQINCLNKITKGHCRYNRENVLTCQISNLHDVTESYFQNNKSAIYVDAQLFLIMDNSAINSPTVIGIHRDPIFKNLSSGECDSSRNTVFIRGQYFSEFISSQVNVWTFKGGNCQMQYINESFMACHLKDDKTKQQDLNKQGDNSTETTTSEIRNGSTRKLNIVTGLQKESQPQRGITTELSTASKKSLEQTCPLTIKLGYMKLLLFKTEVRHRDDSLTYAMTSALVFAIIPPAVLALTLTLSLIKFTTLKKKYVSLLFNDVDSGSEVTTKSNLKQILDSVVEIDKTSDVENIFISLDQLIIGKVIGHGNFGLVYEGLLLTGSGQQPQAVAVKTLKDPTCHNIDLQGLVREAVVMREFHHPHVLGLVGLAEKEPGVPYVILPFMANRDLLTYVRETSVTLTLYDVIKYGAEISDGMAYLSQLRCVHRYLAARNCMLGLNRQVKVADFGLCRDVYERGYYKCEQRQKLPIRWMAIESIGVGSFSSKSDVWSYGIVLWEMLTRGIIPYPCVDGWDVINFLKRRRLAQPYFCPDVLYRHMMSCWDEDPDKRPSFEILKTELSHLVDEEEQESPNTKTTQDLNNDTDSSVHPPVAGFSNYQNSSAILLELSEQSTKERFEVAANVVNGNEGVYLGKAFERKDTLKVFITMPACYVLRDQADSTSVAKVKQGLQCDETTEYVQSSYV